MEMKVRHLLPGRLSVSQRQTHPFTLKPRYPQGARQLLRDLKDFARKIRRQIGHEGDVIIRDHQNVTGIHRLNVHEGRDPFASMNKRTWYFASKDVTQNALHRI